MTKSDVTKANRLLKDLKALAEHKPAPAPVRSAPYYHTDCPIELLKLLEVDVAMGRVTAAEVLEQCQKVCQGHKDATRAADAAMRDERDQLNEKIDKLEGEAAQLSKIKKSINTIRALLMGQLET